MANCCSGSTCQELVTLGYMREMVNGTDVGGCFVVSGGSDFSSCCDADESAYTPTYGEITGGTYARRRGINDLDPSQDVNGFSVSTMPSSFISCCSANANDGNISKDKLFFGYTELSGLTFEYPRDLDECEITILGTEYEIKPIIHYIRHEISLSNDCSSFVDAQTLVTGEDAYTSVTYVKEYSNFLHEKIGNTEIMYRIIGYNPTINNVSVTVSAECPYREVTENAIFPTFESGRTSISFENEEIPCVGREITFNYSGDCSDDSMRITQVVLNGGESTYTGYKISSIEIPQNSNHYINNSIIVTINNGQATYYFNLNRDSCLLYASNDSAMDCGLFPGTDDWTKFVNEGRIEIHN